VAWVVLVAAILGWAVRHDELPWRRRRVELAEEREPARVA